MRVLRIVLFMTLLVVALFAQKKDEKKPDASKPEQPAQKKDEAKKDQDKPKDLFGGKKAGLKSSRQSSDEQTAGFNGLDPEGKVEKAALDANPTGADTSDAQSLVAYAPNKEELNKFVNDGHLKAKDVKK